MRWNRDVGVPVSLCYLLIVFYNQHHSLSRRHASHTLLVFPAFVFIARSWSMIQKLPCLVAYSASQGSECIDDRIQLTPSSQMV